MVNKEFIPNGWRKVTIDDICELRRGASPRPISDPKYFGNGAGWVRISDVTRAGNYLKQTEQYLSKLGESKSVKVTPGEVIMSICATIGRPIIVDMEACIHDGFVVFKNLSEHVNNLFFLYWLKTKENYFNSLGQQGTQKNLNTNIVKKTEILLPPLPVQRKIAAILSSVDEAIEKTEAIIEQTEKVKKGLMQQLLTKGIGHTRFKKTEIGEIPEEWEVKSISEVAKVVSGGTPSKQVYEYWENGTIPWATPTDITSNDNKYISTTQLMITESGLRNSSANLLPEGSVLMTSRATIGSRCINTVPMATNQGFKSFICDPDVLHNEYLYYLIDKIKDQFIALASGSTFLEISKSAVETFKIPVPPLEEQIEIAKMLSSLDEKLSVEKVKKESLQTIKKGLMQSLLTGKVRVKVDEDEVVSS
ncbi:restriction endonuclease subunit S [Saccharococcus caldoxylosilyticus]|uniref:restriction endonuclease subunit S n=1 Tax=Saccharococcus caldoxylosilyticus TaxID=81408 RepID=UPI003D344455